MFSTTEKIVFGVVLLSLIGMYTFIFHASIKEQSGWEIFKVKQNCKIVTHIKGDVFNTIGVSAQGSVVIGIGSTPDKKGWLCDDGKTYFR